MTPRVLLLAHAFPRHQGDPVGSFILNFAVALRDAGIACSVLAPGGPGLRDDDEFDGVPVRRYRYAPRRYETLAYRGDMDRQARASLGGGMAMAGLLAASTRAAVREHRRSAFDVLHAHWWFPGGVAGATARWWTRTPLVTTMHGSDVRLLQHAPAGRPLYRWVARSSSALTCVSSWLAAQLPLSARQPVVAPMPVPVDLFPLAGEHEPDRLLFVGKLSEQKGLPRLLRAMTRLRTPVRLTVVGAGRLDDAPVRELARTLGLDDRIEWLPLLTQRELGAQYRRAAIHVIPALDEGLGLTAVESLLSGTPVVAFRSGGVPDVVVTDRTGVLVEPGDEAALAAAIDRLMERPDERSRMGLDGRNRMLATFSPSCVAAVYSRLYERVMQQV